MNDVDFSDLIPQQTAQPSTSGDLSFDDLIPNSASGGNSVQNAAQQNKNTPQKSDSHSQTPYLVSSPDDNAGMKLLKGTVNTVAPYLYDKNPDLSTGKQVLDYAAGTGSGLAQTAVGAITAPIDILRSGVGNAGEYLGTKAANAITGRDEQPQYMQPITPKVMNALNYEPQTAAGERGKLLGQVAGPFIGPKAAVGAADNTAGAVRTMYSGARAQNPAELQNASIDLFNGTNNTYRQMRANGAVYNPDSIQELQQKINNALTNVDIIPALRPETNNAVQQINDAAENGTLSLNHLDQYRRLLRGASGEDEAAAGAVRKAIDSHVNQTDGSDLMSGSPDAVAWLNRGRAEYTRAANFDDVSTILQKANGDPTKIKNRLSTFLADTDNTRGMTTDEIQALRKAATTSTPEFMSKMLGKAGFSLLPTGNQGNGVLPYVMAASKAGAAPFVPGGIPLVAAGTAARNGQVLYARGKAQNALDLIGNRELPPMPGNSPDVGLLEAPPIYGNPPSGPPSSPTPASQRLLPRGGEDTYYQPQGRSLAYQPGGRHETTGPDAVPPPPMKRLTYQPRPDYEVTPDGFTQRPSDVAPPAQRPAEGAIASRAGEEMADRNVKRLMITHQPRPDFTATPEITSNRPNPQTGPEFSLGEAEGMPMGSGDLAAMRRLQNGNARGGRIAKLHSGAIYPKPKYYPALKRGNA